MSTVKCFTEARKDSLVSFYKTGQYKIIDLAALFNTSTRTIGRVLVERGLATPVPRLKGEAYHVMKTLEAHGIKPEQLEQVIQKAKDFDAARALEDEWLEKLAEQRAQIPAVFQASKSRWDNQIVAASNGNEELHDVPY
jgi:hypothetical protein